MNAKPLDTPGPATIEALGNGRFCVRGALHAETVTALLERSEALFKDVPQLEVDLAGVPEGDSAGLALLIEWLRRAKQHQQAIRYKNVPKPIIALAKISEVEDLVCSTGGC